MAVIEGSKDLIETVRKKKGILLDYKHCSIDISNRLMRCQVCKLGSHKKLL